GDLEFLGRIDRQVKVRGFRIELGEIEIALQALAEVHSAVVMVRQGASGDPGLVAYVVPEAPDASNGAELGASGLRSALQASLPDYMVPSVFVILDTLPLTPNGKVDRDALPAPETASEASRDLPRTAVEDLLSGIWSEVLGRETVGVEEDFFALGGHSLLATRVVSRIRSTFRTELPVRALFEAPTVAELAAAVEDWLRDERGVEPPPLAPLGRATELPLSFAQQRLWFINQLEPGSSAYNLPSTLRFERALEPATVAAAFGELVRRHESLRTSFPSVAGQPVQRIAPPAPVQLPVVDLEGLLAADRAMEARRLMVAEATRPFDLARGPVLRHGLLRQGSADWVLWVTMHHIASDGWSMEILTDEVSTLYEALSAGRPSPLAELPIQYADYSAWQRDWLSGDVLAGEIDHWRRQLAGAPAVLELPTDRPRPAVMSYRGDVRSLRLPLDLARSLEGLSRRQGTTLFMTLLASFQALLWRWSGQPDICVGTPIAGRNQLETEGLIGFFVNTLVLRTRFQGDPTVSSLLGRARETTLDAYTHQELPFEKLVEELQPERSLIHSPLFQVMFAMQDTLSRKNVGAVAGPQTAGMPNRTVKFDLTLAISEAFDGLRGALSYSTELFDATTIERMARQLGRLLASFSAAPERRVSELPLLAAAERHQLLRESNANEIAGQGGLSAHRRIVRQAELRGDAVAVVCEGHHLSYRELARRAGALAAHLERRGAGSEVAIAVCLDPSVELPVAILAVLRTGAVYLPLDPTQPAARLEEVLADSGARLALGDERGLEALSDSVAQRVLLSGAGPEWLGGGLAPAPGPIPVGPESLAYVIYTSGSTGRPKGVGIEHRQLAAYLDALDARLGLEAGASWVGLSPITADLGHTALFGALCSGGTFHAMSREKLADPAAVEQLLGSVRPAGLKIVPSHLSALLAAVERPELLLPRRWLVVGGEACPRPLVTRVTELAPACRVVNHYGPTETTIGVATHEASREPGAKGPVPFGKPLGSSRLFVVDPGSHLVPFGVPGELLIAGAQLGRGYLGRPALTAERFRPDPFSGLPGGRVYRSGDLVRRHNEGALEFLSRLDHQVKLRGFRIELGEIEAALVGLQAVREAVVVLRKQGQEHRLAAYVVPEGPMEPTSTELWAALKETLPEHMVPSSFLVLEALPLAATGKIDRAALPAPELEVRTDSTTPRTVTEEILGGIWAEVLGVEGLGVEDDFFELGGHSLLATQVVSRIRQTFRLELPVRALFETPTVAGLAALVDRRRNEERGVEPPPFERRSGEEDLPLSFAQQRLWFIDQLEPGSSGYNIATALRVERPLDPGALAAAFSELVRRHETLRTSFPAVDGKPVQRIAPVAAVRIPVVDLRRLPEAAREIEARRLTGAEADRPFDLARGPVLRVGLLCLDSTSWVLLVTVHHIASDAWSRRVLTREVTTLYDALLAGRPSPLEELPIQYADYAVWQRRWLSGEVLEAEIDHWRRQLSGAPPLLELPTDRPRPALMQDRGTSRSLRLPENLASSLEALCRRQGATLFMALLAGFQALLSRWSGLKDVCVGTPIAGRNRLETEGLIGFFVNTLVLRARFEDDPDMASLLAHARDATLEAQAHQDLPFEKMVDELQPERSMSHSPLFQVMFVLQNEASEEDIDSAFQAQPMDMPTQRVKFDLTLAMAESEGALVTSLVFRIDLFDSATIVRLLHRFERVLTEMVAAPERRVSQLSLLSPSELHQVRAEWGAGDVSRDDGRLAHQLFAAHAAQGPAAVAVVAEESVLTYGELDHRARRLAGRLSASGAGPEAVVAVLMDRSPEQMIALVAALRIGAAYMPLDPAHPEARLHYMISDSGARIVLTKQRFAAALDELPGLEVLCLDRPEDAVFDDMEAAQQQLARRNLAYVIYTSGSTGKPKGTEISHAGLASLVAWHQNARRLRFGDRMTLIAGPGFDASVLEIWPTLTAGATLVIPSIETVHDTVNFAQWLAQQRVQLSFLPTPLCEAFLATPLPQEWALRSLLTGGEQLQRRPSPEMDFELVDHYGPTEATVVTTSSRVAPEGGGRPPSIGRPIDGTRIEILDNDLGPCSMGAPGELWIGGVGLARGYRRRPRLTAERFLPDPYSDRVGSRLYAAGDQARFLASGKVEFLGRNDHQVKVRGFRIELGEVEVALARLSSVRDAVVVVGRGASGDRRLVAFVVPEGGGVPTAAELRAGLIETLPEYMVPAAFRIAETLPLTPNGKVDRAALLQQAESGDEEQAHAGYQEPVGVIEKQLSEIWSQVLGIEKIGVDDNFFELGGDSILSIQIVARANQAAIRLSPKLIFQHPTIRELAILANDSQVVAAEQGPVTGAVPLTPIQHYFLDRDPIAAHHFNQSMLLEVNQELGDSILETATRSLIEHHDALRLRFRREASGWVQENAGFAGDVPWSRIDLSRVAPEIRQTHFDRVVAKIQASLNLEQGPLLRTVLLHLGADEADRVLITIHHLAVDGVSWRILIEDFETGCGQLRRGQHVQLPAKTTSFKQWANELEEYANSKTVQADLAYWSEASRAEIGKLPVECSGGAGRNTVIARKVVSRSLDAEETRMLLQVVPSIYKTQINEVLLTALVMAFEPLVGTSALLV
ncbi:MAG: amino acid adenylation domain-containing protein, partial [Acidobacteriota bacterium]